MAAAGLVALFRSCMDSLKSILTSQEFGAEYELLCTELSLQCLRFRLWGSSVGINVEASNSLQSSIINRPDLQPTFDQAVSSIAYLLKEIEELRREYQLNQSLSVDGSFKDDAKSLRVSKSRSTLSSFKSTFALRQRMRENQSQKSFLAITKWAICDARRFDEKVRRLKCLIDGLEDITKAAGLSHREMSVHLSTVTLQDESPPPYSAAEPLPQYTIPLQRVDEAPLPEIAVATYNTFQQTSLSVFLKCIPIMKGFLSVCPDESRIERPRVRSKLLALSHQLFQELSEDVHDELLRRQRYDDQTPQWLPPDASLHPKRNEARKKLSALHFLRFPHLVADTVFEFERRFPNFQNRVVPPHPDAPFPDTAFPHLGHPCGLCPPNDPPPRLQYRAAHQSTNVDPASLGPMIRGPVPTSSFCVPRNFRNRVPEPVQLPPQSATPQTPYIREDSVGREWPLDRVLSWLVANNFSSDWQETFKALNISGSPFLDLVNSHRGRGAFGMLHQQIYPQLAKECAKSGNGWDQVKERSELKRMRRLMRNIKTESIMDEVKTSSASVEIFKSFRVSMEDPTYKVLPAALKKYNINAPWDHYALYILYGDSERCLGMDEKPLVLLKQLDKAGKKPMFMLRKIARVPEAAAASSGATSEEERPGGII